MANGDIQDNLANDYLSKYNLNLGVAAVTKLSQFTYIQNLTYNGILDYLTNNFLGLSDWQQQIQLYSSSNLVLKQAYSLIEGIVKLNTLTSENITYISGLGDVGNEFESIQGYSKVFSLSNSELTDPSSAQDKVDGLL